MAAPVRRSAEMETAVGSLKVVSHVETLIAEAKARRELALKGALAGLDRCWQRAIGAGDQVNLTLEDVEWLRTAITTLDFALDLDKGIGIGHLTTQIELSGSMQGQVHV